MPANYEPIWRWVTRRDAIRQRRVVGDPPPWTDDPILATYRFCNVRREDDKVTRWIAEHIRKPFAEHSHLWFMLAIGRIINRIDTLAYLIDSVYLNAWPSSGDFRPDHLRQALDERAAAGMTVFTGAYTITAPATKGVSKTRFVTESTLGNLWTYRDIISRRFVNGRSLRDAHAVLMSYPGWGPFMAYQVVVDARFCPGLLANAHDTASWAAAGPGTLRGLNRIHERQLDHRISQDTALTEMLPIYARCEAETGVAIDLSDVPNLLCETDKYLRVLNGEGTPRQRYVAKVAA